MREDDLRRDWKDVEDAEALMVRYLFFLQKLSLAAFFRGKHSLFRSVAEYDSIGNCLSSCYVEVPLCIFATLENFKGFRWYQWFGSDSLHQSRAKKVSFLSVFTGFGSGHIEYGDVYSGTYIDCKTAVME